MSLPALIGFAGVLVAAVATGMLAGQCVRQPRIDFVLWTTATLGLTVALAAQSMGFAGGFGSTTFRAVQLLALVLAPLWLAWGLVEAVARNDVARFGARLVSSALMVVALVILVTDPLNVQPFSKSWPSAGLHFQPVALYALDVVQVVAIATAVASTGLAAARARRDPRWRPALTGVASVSLAVLMTAGLRFSLPVKSGYPLLAMLAAALVWFGASRIQRLPARAVPSRDARDAAPEAGYRPDRDRGLVEDYEADGGPGGQYATYGYQGPRSPGRPLGPGGFPEPNVPDGADLRRRTNPGPPSRPPERPASRPPERPEAAGGLRPGTPSPDERQMAPAREQMASSSGPGGTAMTGPDPGFGTPAKFAGSPAAAQPRPYGRILIFTLLDDRAADFDRLAEQTAEEVRTGEPDTLVYVIHLVPNAPLQRIFYEIYRDRAAFEGHENQPYMKRFVTDRRSYVLATNVIELTLKYAKVAPLPNPQPAGTAPPGARAQLLPGPSRGTPPRGTQRLQPLPPARTQRLDQAQRPVRPGPIPSAGRPYGGT